MARNGSGTMQVLNNSWSPPINGQLATAGDWQAIYLDLVAALTQSLSRDGQTVMTGDLQMGGNKITGQAAATGTGQALIYEQLFSQGTEADLASAATTDIGAQLTNFLRITGTTTITSFGTNYKGPRFLRFAGAVTLTNGAALTLPGGANITTAAGDCCIVIPRATLGTADGWQVMAYQGASGITTSNIANNAVTYAKMQSVSAGKVLGRDTSGAGVVQELPIAIDTSGNAVIGASSPTSGYRLTLTGGSGLNISNVGATDNSIVKYSNSVKNWYAGLRGDTSNTWALADDIGFRLAVDTNGNLQFNSGYGSVANAYGCRAWVNFNGTGTVAIRGSGNVSSITDNAVGDYTVNFTSAMPDVNYAMSGCCRPNAGQVGLIYEQTDSPIRTTTQLRIYEVSNNVLFDSAFVSVSIFR